MKHSSDERWKEARKRVEPYVHAVFWQDLGVEDSQRYVDWILDRLVKHEFLAVLEDNYALWKSDENRDRILLISDLKYPEARKILNEKLEKDPNTYYWIQPNSAP
ncbi:hypothetical protein EHQ52_17060 [Leptospira koniambonensis]|uniref:Uncharacterized protein n=1 Tax=Leptospira koniambonensis TaxID=2484950 RepID=A0A4R9J3Z4_9LEPT|nr:hypothetical protein [Leptospira koniambonensis]TGL31636.1 hypothetical protein EHQ52_17060 [Leptospira koniambonensis]